MNDPDKTPPELSPRASPKRPSFVANPVPQLPAETPTNPGIRVARRRGNFKTIAGMLSAALGLGGGGYVGHYRADNATHDKAVIVEERLNNHIKDSTERSEKLEKKVDRMGKMSKAQNEAVLDALRVPKSKRPTEDEE